MNTNINRYTIKNIHTNTICHNKSEHIKNNYNTNYDNTNIKIYKKINTHILKNKITTIINKNLISTDSNNNNNINTHDEYKY